MKNIEERLNAIENKMEFIQSMINHLNNVISNKTIEKIELDFNEAVKQQIEELKKTEI